MQRLFFIALGLATALPVLGVPLLGATGALQAIPVSSVVGAIVAFTGAHILATAWFGLDADYSPSMRASPWRMYGAFLLVPAGMLAVALASPTASGVLFGLYTIWLAHHYSRQNFGILSFAAARDGFGKLPQSVSLIVHLTTIAGAAGMVFWAGNYAIPQSLRWLVTPAVLGAAFVVSITAFIAAAVLIGRLILTEPKLRRSPTLLSFLGLTWAFYLPVLLVGGTPVSFWPYAIAHGAQYWIFMAVTSGRSKAGWPAALGLAVGVSAIAFLAPQIPVKFYAPVWTGLVIWHFLVDARLWKMSDAAVRGIVRQRFDFVFTKARPSQNGKAGVGYPAAGE